MSDRPHRGDMKLILDGIERIEASLTPPEARKASKDQGYQSGQAWPPAVHKDDPKQNYIAQASKHDQSKSDIDKAKHEADDNGDKRASTAAHAKRK